MKTSEQWNAWIEEFKVRAANLYADLNPETLILMETAFFAGHTNGIKMAQEIFKDPKSSDR